MEFVKMHGLGNDFIILDDTDHRQKNGREGFETEKHCCEESELSPELVRHFCDRHRGIGADGVIRVCNAEHPQADFRMKLYNADGSPAKMCGNGIRCLGKYVYDHGKTEKVNLLIETDAGLYRLQLIKKEDTDRICSVRVDMGPRNLCRSTYLPVFCCFGRCVYPWEIRTVYCLWKAGKQCCSSR